MLIWKSTLPSDVRISIHSSDMHNYIGGRSAVTSSASHKTTDNDRLEKVRCRKGAYTCQYRKSHAEKERVDRLGERVGRLGVRVGRLYTRGWRDNDWK